MNVSGATHVRYGLLTLSAIFATSVATFWASGEYDWVGAIWMTVITISSVGYGETSEVSRLTQIVSIGVILFGMSAAAYTFAGIVRMTFEGELDEALGHRRIAKELAKLQNHVVICGYGRIGQELANSLYAIHSDFVVIDEDPARCELAKERTHLAYNGDATADEVLQRVGVQRARTLVSALPSDAQNVFITLTARNLNPELQVIARAERRETESKLRQAGADRIVTPAITGAQQMIRMITRPSTADLIELVSETAAYEFELDEVLVTSASPLVGESISDIDGFRTRRVLLVAIKPPEGPMEFNPSSDRRFQPHEILIVLGNGEEIAHMRAAERLG